MLLPLVHQGAVGAQVGTACTLLALHAHLSDTMQVCRARIANVEIPNSKCIRCGTGMRACLRRHNHGLPTRVKASAQPCTAGSVARSLQHCARLTAPRRKVAATVICCGPELRRAHRTSRARRYSLQYVFGVGDTTACKILQAVQIDPTRRTYDLNEDELAALREEVETYTVEGDLRRQIALNIKRCAPHSASACCMIHARGSVLADALALSRLVRSRRRAGCRVRA